MQQIPIPVTSALHDTPVVHVWHTKGDICSSAFTGSLWANQSQEIAVQQTLVTAASLIASAKLTRLDMG